MRLRRTLAVGAVAAAAIVATTAFAFPSTPVDRAQPLPALTAPALAARYAADSRLIAHAARAGPAGRATSRSAARCRPCTAGTSSTSTRPVKAWRSRSSATWPNTGDWIRDVPHVQFLGLGFGQDPMDPAFGARIFDCGGGGHSDYFRPGAVALRNLAYIALGDPAWVTR